jgi:hypothetical protein
VLVLCRLGRTPPRDWASRTVNSQTTSAHGISTDVKIILAFMTCHVGPCASFFCYESPSVGAREAELGRLNGGWTPVRHTVRVISDHLKNH